jgi:hypothetical protein
VHPRTGVADNCYRVDPTLVTHPERFDNVALRPESFDPEAAQRIRPHEGACRRDPHHGAVEEAARIAVRQLAGDDARNGWVACDA